MIRYHPPWNWLYNSFWELVVWEIGVNASAVSPATGTLLSHRTWLFGSCMSVTIQPCSVRSIKECWCDKWYVDMYDKCIGNPQWNRLTYQFCHTFQDKVSEDKDEARVYQSRWGEVDVFNPRSPVEEVVKLVKVFVVSQEMGWFSGIWRWRWKLGIKIHVGMIFPQVGASPAIFL